MASPSYLAAAPALATPEDLHTHRCLYFLSPRGKPVAWTWRGAELAPPVTACVGNGNALIQAALAGAGVVQVFRFAVLDALKEGRLIEVLPRWAAPGPPLNLLYAPSKRRLARVRVVIDALVDGLQHL